MQWGKVTTRNLNSRIIITDWHCRQHGKSHYWKIAYFVDLGESLYSLSEWYLVVIVYCVFMLLVFCVLRWRQLFWLPILQMSGPVGTPTSTVHRWLQVFHRAVKRHLQLSIWRSMQVCVNDFQDILFFNYNIFSMLLITGKIASKTNAVIQRLICGFCPEGATCCSKEIKFVMEQST